ncbi:adenine phosphoribosyltransferase [Microbulbifer sp. YPW16]|uniref:adenine phosphoribosyltransferase n=1 Tax=unclassified Microbulbifer TaxID=2619833 RepID=UPI001E540232|nr:adenine phosphoribosyltransferase [Microbulbifer sp. YPW16]UHQ56999.1 adenine phosphoribosyltransferase [Microbulbifer sp. YPW16]
MSQGFDPKSYIRTIPDWPEPGVQFRDITTLLENARAFRCVIDTLVQRYFDADISAVVGVDARGFILGAPLAYELKTGFVPVRKKGKLPFDTITESYQLEYGTAEVELHADALRAGDRVILVDDLIATGGTLLAASSLISRLGAEVVEACAIIDLPDLGGSEKLGQQGLKVFSLCQYRGE